MMNWRDYWDRDNPIYVSDRHKLLHYRLVARDIAALVPSADAHVLDHGCGEALSAGMVAERCARLWLCDAAPNVRAGLVARFVNVPKIGVIAPETIEPGIPYSSLDLVVANSVLQYLSRDELRESLSLWLSKLRTGGRLILADVIPPDVGPLTDAKALLSFAWSGGFLVAALGGLVRTALSDYRKIRQELGLSTYTPADIQTLLREAGYVAIERRDNIGHNPARMSFVAVKPD
jgi:SAM-dependent methyltransferase